MQDRGWALKAPVLQGSAFAATLRRRVDAFKYLYDPDRGRKR